MYLETLFSHYFPPTEDPSASFPKARVIFDTNVFLDLYRLGPVARGEVLAGLREGVADRLWIPHHVLLEVSKNRTALVLEALDRQQDNIANVEAARVQAHAALESAAIAQSLADGVLKEVLTAVDGAFEKIAGEIRNSEETSRGELTDDVVLQFINEVLQRQKITALTQDWYDKAAKEAADRAARKLPPGYKDERKDEVIRSHDGVLIAQKYGDFYIWKQLLEQVKLQPVEFQHIVFVTSDRKEDWWEIARGKAQGPRPELRLEVLEAGASSFHMYQLTRLVELLRAAQPRKGGTGTISEKTLEDVREVEQQSEGLPDEGVSGSRRSFWTELIDRGSQEGYRGFYTQRVVGSWLRGVFEGASIVEHGGFPDLIVRFDDGSAHGFEVVTPRNLGQLRALIVGHQGLARAWLTGGRGGLLSLPEERRLTFVVTLTPRVTSGTMAESLWIDAIQQLARDVQTSNAATFMIGRVKGDQFELIAEVA